MKTNRTIASCPGKVLVLGGYAVLERPNCGLVLAVDARFYVECEWRCIGDGADKNVGLVLESPQWGGWEGRYSYDESLEKLLPTEDSRERNAYVEKTVEWTLSVARQVAGPGSFPRLGEVLYITLRADNDFYSQQANLKDQGLKPNDLRLLQLHAPVRNKSAKTGLGSSAAMISALVSGILRHVASVTDVESMHRVAQVAHAAVQGKVGSGFDVCCAFFGSMSYVRYDAQPLQPCLSLLTKPPTHNNTNNEAGKAIWAATQSDLKWNHRVEPCRLPPHMNLLCGDVAGGSETPSMSRAILEWKNASDGHVWEALLARNDHARHCLALLHELARTEAERYQRIVKQLSILPSSRWTSLSNDNLPLIPGIQAPLRQDQYMLSKFIECKEAFAVVRQSLRLVGQLANVPVEPPEQTMLCDATLSQCPGVLACGVPGAGGFDAVYALVLHDGKPLEAFWLNYPHAFVCPLLLRESSQAGLMLTTTDAKYKL